MHHARQKLVFWVSGLVFGMYGLVFWMCGFVFWTYILDVWTCILGVCILVGCDYGVRARGPRPADPGPVVDLGPVVDWETLKLVRNTHV